MTSFLMSLAATAVASSGLAENCEIVSRGTTYRTRATWTFRENSNEDEGISLRSAIRIPIADIGREVDVNDAVRIDGRTFQVAHCWIRTSVLDIGLTEWRAR